MTASEIEGYITAQLLKSELKTAIKGTIYKEGTRLANSDKEDAVITFVDGLEGIVSTGVLIINVYVKDIDNGKGQLVKDTQRCKELEKVCYNFAKSLPINPFLWQLDSTIKAKPVPDIKQHYINIRLKYRLIEF